jgi:benzoyl-CoA reductase/2-hydroxyglutaryl-CoA dehydratase subunit BcrC/BadD/HgdB
VAVCLSFWTTSRVRRVSDKVSVDAYEENLNSNLPQELSAYSQFESFSENSLRELETAKEAQVKVAGTYCLFAPTELIRAAGVIPVSLCGKQQAPIAAAEQTLPAALCPLIKSSYGFAITNSCPFFDAADFIIGETTCDGKKKMFEFMTKLKPLHLMHLPYTSGYPATLEFWYAEILRLKTFLEDQTGVPIRADDVAYQINLQNQVRLSFQRLMELNQPRRKPITGGLLLPVMESKGFAVDIEKYLALLARLIDEFESSPDNYQSPSQGPRILLTGTPIGKGSDKVLRLIEEAGGIVVCMENCTGIKGIYSLVDETSSDPFRAIAKRYLEIPCSCMTPNTGRFEMIERLIQEYQVDGVVDLSWQCCHTYTIESGSIQRCVKEKHNIPFLHIATDYSPSDTGQLAVRIGAFLELLGG